MRAIDPNGRLGIYKRLADVPDRRRLYRFADRYDGEDTWGEWCADRGFMQLAHRTQRDIERSERRWKEYVCDHSDAPHHALARPEHVEGYFAWLRTQGRGDGMGTLTIRRVYATRIQSFYHWLMTDVRHPHTYSPIMQAFADPSNENARAVWRNKMQEANPEKNLEVLQ
jgi:hypothetical protein